MDFELSSLLMDRPFIDSTDVILLKLGTLDTPVMGSSRSFCRVSWALMTRMVFVDPDPGFHPVTMTTGLPGFINPLFKPTLIPM